MTTCSAVLNCFIHTRLFAPLWPVAWQASLSMGILQARMLEWVAMPSPGDLPDPVMEHASLASPALAGGFFTTTTTWKAWKQSVQLVMSDCLRPHGLQHARLLCPSPTHGAWSNSCPLNQWCHPTISSSVIPSSSCLQPFPASGSFPMSQFFTSGGQRQIHAGWEHTSWLSLGEDGLREPFNCWIDSQVLWCPRGL